MKKLLLLSIASFLFNVAFAQEDCGNGVDDDGDGLIDCADTVSCTSNSVPTGTLFNTATNGSGGVLPGGSNDANWQVSIGALAGPYAPAVVMSSIPGSYYASPWPDCAWISHNALGTHSLDQDFYYRIQFYLPCFSACGTSYMDSAVFCLSMDFFSDNSVDEVYVNGIPQSAELAGVPAFDPYYNVGFSAAGGLSFSLCDDWQPGLNELVIKVSSGPGFEGFLAQNSTSAPPPSGDPTILSPFSNFTVCASAADVNFAAASPGGTWSATCGSCMTSGGVFDPSTAGPGIYMVTYSLTVPCPASDTSLIEVLALPPDATINPEPSHCINDPAFYLSPVTAGGIWSGTGITNTANGTFSPAVSGAGTFTITHIFSGTCADTATQTVTVTALPTPNFTSNINSGCIPVCVNFSELPGTTCAGGVMYYFGDGDSATTSSPSHCYNDAGSYTVTIECTDANGCTGTTMIPNMISVLNYPIASFTIAPSAVVDPNTSVTFTSTSTSALILFWDFGDPSSPDNTAFDEIDPDHTYASEGTYCINLYACNDAGCCDTAKNCIIVEGEGTIFIPNVFTPNGDLSNDLFMVSSAHMKEMSYSVYDRWGLKMADHVGLTGGWNGQTKSGRPAPDGTYFYILKAMTIRGKEINAEGYIQLLSEK